MCVLSGQERASVAGCDTCFVTWISPLVYPTTSYTQLPLETVPFPHPLLPLLHGDPSMPFEYLVHRASQPHAPPFFAKPSPRPNSCRGRNRVCVYVRAASILHSRFAYLDEACGLDRGIGIAFSFFFLIGYRLYS